MDSETVAYLNGINRAFYATTADAFSGTRGRAWPGWARIPAPARPAGRPLRILDVGCGNGRFAHFAAEAWAEGGDTVYLGVDNSSALLTHAAISLEDAPGLHTLLVERDLIDAPLHPPANEPSLALHGPFDAVACFGVLHHIPGRDRRAALVQAMASWVAPGGVLAVACWQFYDHARFRQRVVAWPAEWAARVEPGDYLLDWRDGPVALRYCHHCDDSEVTALAAAAEAAGLQVRARYAADGHTGTVNAYFAAVRA